MSDHDFLSASYARLRSSIAARGDDTLPPTSVIRAAEAALPRPGDADFLAPRGPQPTLDHILTAVVPALNGQNLSGRYFGFVTGSLLPVAEAADNVVSALDQNVQVHLPDQTVATAVEHATLQMLIGLLRLDEGNEKGNSSAWTGTFTTGATASNVLGLALGREAVIAQRLPTGRDIDVAAVGELGLIEACSRANVKGIRVLTSMSHSSLGKAASIVGIGRASVKQLPRSADEPWRLDPETLERELLLSEGHACIIAVSAGEVNTGGFAVMGKDEWVRIRYLADKYRAWLHVDAAFGMFARALPDTDEFAALRDMVDGIELADSITADGHKMLNVPYDAGIFFSRGPVAPSQVFQNPNAAYLSAQASAIPSPLNNGLENSRRFRALPIYAVLLSEGRSGLAEMFARMTRLARKIAAWIHESDAYELLPEASVGRADQVQIIVLFRAKNEALNGELVQRINETRKMYVSGTSWKGKAAVRVAVSSWRVDVEKDFGLVEEVLSAIGRQKA